MKRCARRTDEVFLKMKHDPGPGGAGLIAWAATNALEPESDRGRTRLWQTGYGEATSANFAMCCYLRWQQTRLEGYRKLVLATANSYLDSDPDWNLALHPSALADAIGVLLAAHRISGDAKFLDRADHFARIAVDLLFDDGPLPRATSRHDHYETITRCDTLAMVLLDLWLRRNMPGRQVRLVWSDR
jgi:hypothetical protein